MKAIWIIAKNTFREIIRDRILYGLLIFALLIIMLSLALGQLSFAEQSRISLNFGLTGIQLSAAILSIFVGSTLVSREIEKRTVLTLLARAMSRLQFLLGKFLGLQLVTITILTGLGAVLYAVMEGLGVQIGFSFLIALWGILLEAAILLGVALFFGSMTSPLLTVICSIGIFLIGHGMNSLVFLAKVGKSDMLADLSTGLNLLLPNLEVVNWRSLPVYNEAINWREVLWATQYSLIWVVLLASLTALIFRRKDFA